MEENINYREELAAIREGLKAAEEPYSNEELEMLENGMYCCVLLAEENLQQQRGGENGLLAKELLGYGEILEGYDHLLNAVQVAANRMAEALYNHPRLKLKLLKLRCLAMTRIECIEDHPIGLIEDIREEICELESNIEAADRGEFDKITTEGHLKHDPVEWTARYEEVIDEVESIVEQRLADHPRGMGFCHAYWHEKAAVLAKYGVEWRSPVRMNPGVMFD